MKTGIFYGSTTGNTANAAQQIGALLTGARTIPVKEAVKASFEACGLLILGTSTWGLGDLQDDWSDSLDSLRAADLRGKKVAIFGLGDQVGHPDSFVDAMGTLYEMAVAAGATVVGKWPTDDYDFLASAAVDGDQFLGLPLDEENQAAFTEERIAAWVEQLLAEAF
ncbi:MAG: flavodoxin [Desulfuromonadales bacterium]|nr:flavodoxin [Desulfuromonadales bacterium]